MERRPCQKLFPRYSGPYQISPVAYELRLPPSSRIHPVFHVSLLRLFRGPTPYPSPHPNSNSIKNINSTNPLSSTIQTTPDPLTTPPLPPNQNAPTHLIPAVSKSPNLAPHTSPNIHKAPTTRNLIHNSVHATTHNLLNAPGPPLKTRAPSTPHNNPLSQVPTPTTVNHISFLLEPRASPTPLNTSNVENPNPGPTRPTPMSKPSLPHIHQIPITA